MPLFYSVFYGQHVDTVYGTGLYAEVTAGTFAHNHGVH